MKNSFPSYYTFTKEQFSDLWEESLFVPDTNVLLHLYRLSLTTREKLINIFTKIDDRLWVPHQVGYEFSKNRPTVILTQNRVYEDAKKELQTLQENITNKFQTFQADIRDCLDRNENALQGKHSRYPFIYHLDFSEKSEKIESIFEKLDQKIESVMKELGEEIDEQEEKRKEEYPTTPNEDHILNTLTSLVDGKVGPAYCKKRLEEIYEEGKTRYKNEVPPGYKDSSDKTGNDIYGDLVLWFQIIDKAKEVKKPIILVTNNRKEDWWWKACGRTIGPQPELRSEMWDKANVLFYMYNLEQFMEFAQEQGLAEVNQEVIDEIKEVRLQDEVNRLQSRPSLSAASEQLMKLQPSAIEQALRDLESQPSAIARLMRDLESMKRATTI